MRVRSSCLLWKRYFAASAAPIPNATTKIFEVCFFLFFFFLLHSCFSLQVVNENGLIADLDNKASKETIIVDCYANWCGPCKKLTPLLEGNVCV
jgi:thiol-disulfide isomerase/thioredoxin